MGLIRIFGLALIVAAAMTLAGGSPAMAESTQLCTNDTSKCEEPSFVHFETSEKGAFLNEVLNVKCRMLITGTPSGPGNPATVTLVTLSYIGCTFGCKMTGETFGTLLILKSGTELATVAAHNLVFNVNCFGFINCSYGSENLTGHLLGPLAAGLGNSHLTYSGAAVTAVKGESCPETAKLDALFISSLAFPTYLR